MREVDEKREPKGRSPRMESLEIYCRKAMEGGMEGAKVIDPHSIVTAEWVRMKCQFGCPGYGGRLCCPPHTPEPDVTRKVLDSYEKALFVHQRSNQGRRAKDFNETLVRLEIEIFLDGYYKAWSMGSGPCRLCKECDVTDHCKHAYEARPSMEACGIDVFKTARDHGFPIEVVRSHEETRNIYGVILVE
jgi:predicted metal-binding protein